MISWHSQKQTLIVTFANHPSNCGLPVNRDPTVLFEDSVACVAQMKERHIKTPNKHIPPKFFSFIQKLGKDKKINTIK